MNETAKYFDGESKAWSERYASSPHFKTRLDTAVAWIGERAGPLELLDYGCGSGVLLGALAPLGHRLTGVDVSEGMLAAARAHLGGGVRLELVDKGAAATYAAQKYDGATCLGVIEYVDVPGMVLRNVGELVRPGGFLIVSFPNRGSVLRWLERAIFKRAGLFRGLGLFGGLTGANSYLHFQKHQFTLEEVGRVLAPMGFELRRSVYHVAPGPFRAREHLPSVGMTIIAEFVKRG